MDRPATRIGTEAGHYLRKAARDDVPARLGSPEGEPDPVTRRVWEAAFTLVVRRRFDPETPLAEISRTVAAGVRAHASAALPQLDAEMMVREALGEPVPTAEIDPTVRAATHLLLFASLTDALGLRDEELDSLVAEAEQLAVPPVRRPPLPAAAP